jgi:DNA primase
MTTTEIKQIKIRDFLASRGISPIKDYGYYGMYHCPFREDRNASFKVDYRKNPWNDFGTDESGSIIDLVMKMENLSFHEAARRLEGTSAYMHTSGQADIFSFHRKNISEDNPSNCILKVIPITHPQLIEYVAERKISLDLANHYCREVHYQNSAGNFFSVGFQNNKGGYELNSPNDFKGCISPKVITTFRDNADACLVFEGFWDFLSYLTIKKIDRTKHDVAVLNSVANVQKAMDFLKAHKEIYTYLDNDEGGRNATEQIKTNCISVNNCSSKIAGFKDLNDYLCGKKLEIIKPKKKEIRL